MVRLILQILGKGEELITFVADRPGHDRRYAINPAKTERELGWRKVHSFEEALRRTVQWYVANSGWWQPLKRGLTTAFSLQ